MDSKIKSIADFKKQYGYKGASWIIRESINSVIPLSVEKVKLLQELADDLESALSDGIVDDKRHPEGW